jgi:DNA-binding NarL/FixJ family response regulator
VVRVLIVDDQALVRRGFRMILDAEPGVTVVGEAGTGFEAVEEAARLQPDVVLMDIRMPGLDGIEATRRITATGPVPRVVVLTTFDLDEHVLESIRAGASGFLLKDVPPEDLVRAIKIVAEGDALLAPSVTRRVLAQVAATPSPSGEASEALASLTDRETDVLRLLARGLSNAEIAGSLFLGETTVKTHVGRILAKLGVRDRVQAVVAAYESGLVTPGG